MRNWPAAPSLSWPAWPAPTRGWCNCASTPGNPAPAGLPQNGTGNGGGFGSFLLVEPINGDWAANHFPNDSAGNVYRASKYPWNANLDYLGANPDTYLEAGFSKTSNQSDNDWTDLISLAYALSPTLSDPDYVSAVLTNANVEKCLLYFVVCNFFDYMETSLCRGVGDDYALYRPGIDTRFQFLAHDFDTILGQGDTGGSTTRSIWSMIDSPASTVTTERANFLARFMRHPEFAPVYFRLYKQQLDTTFVPESIGPLLDQLLVDLPGADSLGAAMKTFAASRRTDALSQIPLTLRAFASLSSSNTYYYSTSASATLYGAAHVIDTRAVLVNGATSTWSAWQGRWTNTVSLLPGLNRVLVQSLGTNGLELARVTVDVWYDDGSVAIVSNNITSDTTWTAAAGPYSVTNNLTVASGATLTIEPGTTIYLGSGGGLTVASGGRLLAEGAELTPIRFTRQPGGTDRWGGIVINGGPGSPETRIRYAHVEFNGDTAIHSSGGTVWLDHLTFGSIDHPYLSLDSSSFVVQDCLFPATSSSFEPVHGTGGIKGGGRGIFLRNFFGADTGGNDALAFTGAQRPGPIVQFINNVFMGSGDDALDLNSTDAWVENNIFLHAHKNGSPDVSSAISGGNDTAAPSDVTILGNIIFDCDHAALAGQGSFFTLFNNTIVHISHGGGADTAAAVVCLQDNGLAEGAGMSLEGNIIYDAEGLTRNVTNAIVTFTNNQMQLSWSGPGGGNLASDPAFVHVPAVAETTNFATWAQAQVMRQWLGLRSSSPALETGPNGRDKGGVIPMGVSISGEPGAATPETGGVLTVGVARTGNGIPAGAWPNGSGYTHYKWRLDGGSWSGETPVTTPIVLTGLAAGAHYVEAVGKRDSGLWQDDPVLGPDATVTRSRTWVVSPAAVQTVRLNEVLASNDGSVSHYDTTPDMIELYNPGGTAVDLGGMRLTDDPAAPNKFVFPAGVFIAARGYLVLYANNPDGTPGQHLGFNLNQEGETLWLYDKPANHGALLDSVTFGPQLTDFSVGRQSDGTWGLTAPTFGGLNQRAPLGDPTQLRINEWLAVGQSYFTSDFIELYNPNPLPVGLGGLFLSDEPMGWPDRHSIAPLTFIPGYGYLRYFADGDTSQGPTHLNFTLSADQGMIALSQPDLAGIDCVVYQGQLPDQSQGRSPNGSSNIWFFPQPTPGAPNPLLSPAPQPVTITLFNYAKDWRYDQTTTTLDASWYATNYDDGLWPVGAGLLANEDCGCLPEPTNTVLTLGGHITYYFRTHFTVDFHQWHHRPQPAHHP